MRTCVYRTGCIIYFYCLSFQNNRYIDYTYIYSAAIGPVLDLGITVAELVNSASNINYLVRALALSVTHKYAYIAIMLTFMGKP